MNEGRIVRLGRIADEKLASEYHAYVTVDGIVERRSTDLKIRLTQAQAEIAHIDARSARARAILDRFNHLDNAQKALGFCLDATNKVAHTGRQLPAGLQSLANLIRELHEELPKRRTALLALFNSTEQPIPHTST